jgi:hypothetical protein
MSIHSPDDCLQVISHAATQKRVTMAGRPLDHQPFTLKDYRVNIGLKALRDGDQRRVELVTMLIQQGGLIHA